MKDLELLDVLNIMSFAIAIANYDENLTQSDKQDLMQSLTDKLEAGIDDIHKHLEIQDFKLSQILKKLEVIANDSRRDF